MMEETKNIKQRVEIIDFIIVEFITDLNLEINPVKKICFIYTTFFFSGLD